MRARRREWRTRRPSCSLKGMIAQYLIRRTYPIKTGEAILFHAAGGVGLITCQWLKALGATVIGTVGSDEKVAVVAPAADNRK